MANIHLKLREIRRRKNLSQEELARKLGISRQAVIALEQGESLPSLPVLVALLHALDIPFNQLFSGREWSPFRATPQAHERVSESHLSTYRHAEGSDSIPATIAEDPTTVYVSAELPGVNEADVTVDLGTQHIVILAVKKPQFTHDAQYCLHEIKYGPIMRILSLPYPVNTEAAEAKFTNGVLYLELPKLIPQTKRRITFHDPQSKDGLETLSAHEEEYGSE